MYNTKLCLGGIMDAIEQFNLESKEIIDKDKDIAEFSRKLNEKLEEVSNLKYNSSLFYKLIHPVKIYKNNREFLRVSYINQEYNDIYNSSIINYITEESGEIVNDLENAARVNKPNYIKRYIKSISLKK